MKVFISYAKEDSEHARKLFSSLSQYSSIEPWLDLEKLRPGDNWKLAINQAITTSRYVLVLLSTRSITKIGYVQKELVKILDQLDYYPPSERYLIPIRIEECTPIHEKLSDLQFIDLFPDYYVGLSKLVRSIIDFSDYETSRIKGYATKLVAHLFVNFPSHLKHLYKYSLKLKSDNLLPCSIEMYELIRFKGSDYISSCNLPMADRVEQLGIIDRFDTNFSRDSDFQYNPYIFTTMGIEVLNYLLEENNPYINKDVLNMPLTDKRVTNWDLVDFENVHSWKWRSWICCQCAQKVLVNTYCFSCSHDRCKACQDGHNDFLIS